jgi:carboxymethylenebutenolidase
MNDGAAIGVYHAPHATMRRGGLIVLQEIFGVTDHLKRLCDDFAEEGYEVLCPSLFDREAPGFVGSAKGEGFQRAVELARDVHPFGQSLEDAECCVDELATRGKVFAVGFCYGGSIAWALAGRTKALFAVSSYYGALATTTYADRAPLCPTLAHFGRLDPMIDIRDVESLIQKAHSNAKIFVYQAGHGFASDRVDHYDRASAQLAASRTRELFDQTA